MQKTISKLIRTAFTLVTLSIYGEAGTGKNLAAKIAHELGSKARGLSYMSTVEPSRKSSLKAHFSDTSKDRSQAPYETVKDISQRQTTAYSFLMKSRNFP